MQILCSSISFTGNIRYYEGGGGGGGGVKKGGPTHVSQNLKSKNNASR